MATQTGLTYAEWEARRMERIAGLAKFAEQLRGCVPGWPKEYISHRPPRVVCVAENVCFGSLREAGQWAGGNGSGVGWALEKPGRRYRGHRWEKYDPKRHADAKLIRVVKGGG